MDYPLNRNSFLITMPYYGTKSFKNKLDISFDISIVSCRDADDDVEANDKHNQNGGDVDE